MNYYFNGSYSKKVQIKFKDTQEQNLVEIAKYLRTSKKSLTNISFEIFDSREGKQKIDPHHSISRASARFKQMTIFRYWEPKDDPSFPHEITHLVAHTWAKPYKWQVDLDTWDDKKISTVIEMVSTSFMQEGLAIAVDEIVFNRKLLENGKLKFPDDWCKRYIKKIPEVTKCINFEGFCSFDNEIIVPFSASLTKYLIQKYGIDKYKNAYISLKETNSADKNVRLLEKIYGVNIKEIRDKWLLNLNKRSI